MKILLLLTIITSLRIGVPIEIYTVVSTEKDPRFRNEPFCFAVKSGKIVPHVGCGFPGPIFGEKWNDWRTIRIYFEKEGYKIYGPDSK